MTKKERIRYEFEMNLKKSFCWRFNLSSNDKISESPCQKAGGNDIFWPEIGSGF